MGVEATETGKKEREREKSGGRGVVSSLQPQALDSQVLHEIWGKKGPHLRLVYKEKS